MQKSANWRLAESESQACACYSTLEKPDKKTNIAGNR